ncbi:MAG: hypothetical protein IJQ66_07205 [Clostridia bacterium]|nr:hypothetical protein [Clostridia bacterium]
MRTVLLAVIPLFGALIGYLISFKYVLPREFFDGFYCLNKKIKTEIEFTKKTIPEILQEKAENDNKNSFVKALELYMFRENKSDNLSSLGFLTKKERDFFERYADNLGSSDATTQLAYLNSIEQELTGYYAFHNERSKKYRPLFIKLGFLFGLIVFILLV